MNELVRIQGVVENFERSTDTRGGSNHTSTTHLSMFKVGSDHVLLKTIIPSVIANGHEVVLAGMTVNGQFQALACRNLTTNWISPLKQQGFAFVALICIAILSFSFFFFIIPIFMGGGCVYLALKVKKHDALLQQAHNMIQ